jgi:hypothetical protein
VKSLTTGRKPWRTALGSSRPTRGSQQTLAVVHVTLTSEITNTISASPSATDRNMAFDLDKAKALVQEAKRKIQEQNNQPYLDALKFALENRVECPMLLKPEVLATRSKRATIFSTTLPSSKQSWTDMKKRYTNAGWTRSQNSAWRSSARLGVLTWPHLTVLILSTTSKTKSGRMRTRSRYEKHTCGLTSTKRTCFNHGICYGSWRPAADTLQRVLQLRIFRRCTPNWSMRPYPSLVRP